MFEKHRTPADVRMGDTEACVLPPSFPAEVRGCSVGCILGMSEVSPFVFIAASDEVHGISRTKEMPSQAGVFWVREKIILFSNWHKTVILFPIYLMPV